MDAPDFSESLRLNNQIATWLNRAALAYKQGNPSLATQALERRGYFQKQLADLENSKAPESPLEAKVFFRDWDANKLSKASAQAMAQAQSMAQSNERRQSIIDELAQDIDET